jgi:hypothetical protein
MLIITNKMPCNTIIFIAVKAPRCVPSALNCEELSTFQALLYISACTVAQAGFFMKWQVKYVTSEGCGLKNQGHFQMANSDKMGDVLQLVYCVGIQRYWQTGGLVCTENSWKVTVTVFCGDTAVLTDRGFGLYWKQLKSYSYSIVWGYSGTDRQGVWFVLKIAEQLQLQYCVGIQRYW